MSPFLCSGELETTLHKELIMVANLQSLLVEPALSKALGVVGSVAQDFLSSRFPGVSELLSDTWVPTTDGTEQMILNSELYECMRHVLQSRGHPPPAPRQIPCSKIQHGRVIYQPFSIASGNSNILFEYPGSPNKLYAGRIESIFLGSKDNQQLTLVARVFKPLRAEDLLNDPYHSHPLIGASGYALARMYYDELDLTTAYILEPKDIVAHVATYKYKDEEKKFSAPCVVILSLDLVRG